MTLTIERLGHRGDGIAEGPVYVARTLPGEVVEGTVEEGRIAQPKIVSPSPHRVSAPCAHYRSCGGCQLQHASDAFVAESSGSNLGTPHSRAAKLATNFEDDEYKDLLTYMNEFVSEYSGGPASPIARAGKELIDWGQRVFGVTINEFYGQTECNMIVSSCGVLEPAEPGVMGFAVPGHDVQVLDEETGAVMPPGEEGSIAVRAPDPLSAAIAADCSPILVAPRSAGVMANSPPRTGADSRSTRWRPRPGSPPGDRHPGSAPPPGHRGAGSGVADSR